MAPDTAKDAAKHYSAGQRPSAVGACAVNRQRIVAEAYQEHQLTGGMGIIAIVTLNHQQRGRGSFHGRRAFLPVSCLGEPILAKRIQ